MSILNAIIVCMYMLINTNETRMKYIYNTSSVLRKDQ